MRLNSSALIPNSAQATRPRAPTQLCRMHCDDSVEQKGRPKRNLSPMWRARESGEKLRKMKVQQAYHNTLLPSCDLWRRGYGARLVSDIASVLVALSVLQAVTVLHFQIARLATCSFSGLAEQPVHHRDAPCDLRCSFSLQVIFFIIFVVWLQIGFENKKRHKAKRTNRNTFFWKKTHAARKITMKPLSLLFPELSTSFGLSIYCAQITAEVITELVAVFLPGCSFFVFMIHVHTQDAAWNRSKPKRTQFILWFIPQSERDIQFGR